MKLQNLLEKFNYTCYYCHRKIGLDEATRDHKYPKSRIEKRPQRRGGGWGSFKDCVLSCRLCNLNKGDKI